MFCDVSLGNSKPVQPAGLGPNMLPVVLKLALKDRDDGGKLVKLPQGSDSELFHGRHQSRPPLTME